MTLSVLKTSTNETSMKFFESLFKKNKKVNLTSITQVIGLGIIRDDTWVMVTQNNNFYVMNLNDDHEHLVSISFSSSLKKYYHTLRDVHFASYGQGSIAMVGTLTINGVFKTIYLESKRHRHFVVRSIVTHPDGAPTKIVLGKTIPTHLVTSLDGELVYREIVGSKKFIHYYPCNIQSRNDGFDHAPLKIVSAEHIPEGIFVLYDASYRLRGYQNHVIGAALLDSNNLGEVLWRIRFEQTPFWESFVTQKENPLIQTLLGAHQHDDFIDLYLYDEDRKEIARVHLHQPYQRSNPKATHALISRYDQNPVIAPLANHPWENHNTFNPTAICLDDKIHLLYRAEGDAGLSVIGYGASNDGYHFERRIHPVYVPRMAYEGVGVPRSMMTGQFRSGYRNDIHSREQSNNYNWHGVEDPRITKIDETLYLIYAAYNGYQQARPVITSISVENFLAERWNWKTPMTMTPQGYTWGEGNKNVVLLPEKINGKFVIFHRIWPHIRIDYVDTLEFGDDKQWLKEIDRIPTRGDSWDSDRVGVSAAPIRIDEGWLMIYQAVSSHDMRYKVGAMILDYQNPAKVLYRSSYPILVPEAWYENEYKAGVAYPCGAVVHDGILKIYYGGSDHYVCIAQAPLCEFVEQLKQEPYQEPLPEPVRRIHQFHPVIKQ